MIADELVRLGRRVRGTRRRATSATLAPFVRAVDAPWWCGARPGKRFWNDCYRRASDYVLAHAPADGPRAACVPIAGLLLVHGVCRDDHAQWAHAWVELPGALIFDGVRQQFYDRDGYYRVLHVTAEAKYDAPATRAHLQAQRHYGPWHDGLLGHDSMRRLETGYTPDISSPRGGQDDSAPASRRLPHRWPDP